MICPSCTTEVLLAEMSIELAADEDGIEVSFVCPGCGVDHFVVLNAEDFEEV
jgi:hypothetical protein